MAARTVFLGALIMLISLSAFAGTTVRCTLRFTIPPCVKVEKNTQRQSDNFVQNYTAIEQGQLVKISLAK